MANIIDNTFFFAELSLGLVTDPAINTKLTRFIDDYEPQFLLSLLGYELKKDYDAGITANTQIYKDIRDGKEYSEGNILKKWNGLSYTLGTAKKSPIANFVYYHYMLDIMSSSTVSGEKKSKAQNAVDYTPRFKAARAWNEMVKMNRELVDFLFINKDIYPQFERHHDFSKMDNLLTTMNHIF